jgi:nitrogen fixation NifU-like protein
MELKKLKKFLRFNMEDQLYREIILEHFKNPLNYGIVSSPDFEIEDFNPLCGDEIKITGKIKNGKLIEIKFQSLGCAISKASASIMTESFLNESIDIILEKEPDDYLKLLEIELSPSRIKCALLGFSALKKSLICKI